jgi:hypothetical protein
MRHIRTALFVFGLLATAAASALTLARALGGSSTWQLAAAAGVSPWALPVLGVACFMLVASKRPRWLLGSPENLTLFGLFFWADCVCAPWS